MSESESLLVPVALRVRRRLDFDSESESESEFLVVLLQVRIFSYKYIMIIGFIDLKYSISFTRAQGIPNLVLQDRVWEGKMMGEFKLGKLCIDMS
jgi:hypothetical protein